MEMSYTTLNDIPLKMIVYFSVGTSDVFVNEGSIPEPGV